MIVQYLLWSVCGVKILQEGVEEEETVDGSFLLLFLKLSTDRICTTGAAVTVAKR